MNDSEDTLILRPDDFFESKTNANDLKSEIRRRDIGWVYHVPSGTVYKHLGGKTEWYTAIAPNPHMFDKRDQFAHVTEIKWYKDRERAMSEAARPVFNKDKELWTIDSIADNAEFEVKTEAGRMRFRNWKEYVAFKLKEQNQREGVDPELEKFGVTAGTGFLGLEDIAIVDNKGQIRFKSFDDYNKFAILHYNFGRIEIFNQVAGSHGLEWTSNVFRYGVHPKIVLLTRYDPKGIGSIEEIINAVEQGRPIYFMDRKDVYLDIKNQVRMTRDSVKRHTASSRKVSMEMPIGSGSNTQPTAEYQTIYHFDERGNLVGIEHSYYPVAHKDIKIRGKPDERLAEIVEKLWDDALFAGIRVSNVADRDGAHVYFNYETTVENERVHRPLDLYNFMRLKADGLDDLTFSLFDSAVRQTAQLLKLGKKVLTQEDVAYVKEADRFGDGSLNRALQIRERYGFQDDRFLEAYGVSIGDLKRALLPKFGSVVTDRYTENFLVIGYCEDPNGKLRMVRYPKLLNVDPDLQYDLATRDLSKLLFVPHNKFDEGIVGHLLSIFYREMGYAPEDKDDFDLAILVANFERHHAWAPNILKAKAAKANTKESFEEAVYEAVYHFNIGKSAEDGLLQAFARGKSGGTSLRNFEYVRKLLHEQFHANVGNNYNFASVKDILHPNIL